MKRYTFHAFDRLLGAAVMLVVLASCSGSSKHKDGGPGDGSVVGDGFTIPDGYTLWPCETPGMSCNAHDTCAIDPICGPDLKCYPQGFQDCSDDLDCTDDICGGMGLCQNVPKDGYCALPVKKAAATDGGIGETVVQCFEKDDRNPSDECLLCDPDVNATDWTEANGGACNDDDDCTKDDYCQEGVCKGVDFSKECEDEYHCTETLCDGNGGCLGHELKSDYCLVEGECYKDKANHPDGQCFICDVSKDQYNWTAITNTCLINSACYNVGDKHTGGCAECDPAVSATKWTVKTNECLISDICKKPGDSDVTGCGTCDPSKNKYDWTPVTNKCLIAGTCYDDQQKDSTGCLYCDYANSPNAWTPVAGAQTTIEGFESGAATGWTFTATATSVKWQVSNKRAAGGSYALYYGNPSTGNFDSGAQNAGTATMPAITLTAGKKAGLIFSLWMDTESGSSFDTLEVFVNGTSEWVKDTTTYLSMETWQEISIDLSPYAGQSVTIKFEFDTQDSILNSTEGVYIDDITIYHNC